MLSRLGSVCFAIGLACVSSQAASQSLKLDFSGSYDSRYDNPFDPGTFKYYSQPVSGWITYDQSVLANYSDSSSATYRSAITGFSFTSAEFRPFYNSETIDSVTYPSFSSLISVQGGAANYGMFNFNVQPETGKTLQVYAVFPQGFFEAPLLPGLGLTSSSASTQYPPGTFYGLQCSEFTPCGPAGEGSISAFTITSASTHVAPPTTLELAQLSQSAYGSSIDSRFTIIESTPLNAGFSATAYRDGDQIVIAFGGTDRSKVSGLKDFIADGSFTTGTPTLALEFYAAKATEFLATVKGLSGDANITLTGHSLGGAIAEILADASKYNATVFDAPGGKGLLLALQPDIGPVNNLSGRSSSQIVNYRLWGDQISLVGDQIGETKTVQPLGSLATEVSLVEAIHFHEAAQIIAALSGGGLVQDGANGPVSNKLHFLAGVGSHVIDFSGIAEALVDIPFDPPPAGGYTFIGQDNSPFIYSLELPLYASIDHYGVSSLSSGEWLAETRVDPLTWFTFNGQTSGFSVRAYDASSSMVNFDEQLIFDLKFASGGSFSARVESLPMIGASVPEPTSWIMMTFGLGLVGSLMRKTSRGKLEVKTRTL